MTHDFRGPYISLFLHPCTTALLCHQSRSEYYTTYRSREVGFPSILFYFVQQCRSDVLLSDFDGIDDGLLVKHTCSSRLDVVKVLVASTNGPLNVKGSRRSEGRGGCLGSSLEALGHNFVLNLLVHVFRAHAAVVDDPAGGLLSRIDHGVHNRDATVVAFDDQWIIVDIGIHVRVHSVDPLLYQ